MSTANGLNLIFGAGGYGVYLASLGVDGHALAREQLNVLKETGIQSIDTSELYEGSEEELAHQQAPTHFRMHNKVKGGFARGRGRDAIIRAGQERLRLLETKQVEVLYLHAPDNTIPLKEQVEAYNTLYQQGVFKQLGLSNFAPQEVQDFYDAAKAYNCVLPTVYEGSYSAVGRLAETDLIPLLHKLGIAYNAYSPIAGGLLAKSKEEFLNGASRFNNSTVLGVLYNSIFNRPSYLTALDAWGDISKDSGLPKAELAFRWVVYHSILSGKHGDGIIFGARDATQLRDTIRIIQAGPLPDNVVKRIDAVWDIVKGEAVLDNWLGYWKAILEG